MYMPIAACQKDIKWLSGKSVLASKQASKLDCKMDGITVMEFYLFTKITTMFTGHSFIQASTCVVFFCRGGRGMCTDHIR